VTANPVSTIPYWIRKETAGTEGGACDEKLSQRFALPLAPSEMVLTMESPLARLWQF